MILPAYDAAWPVRAKAEIARWTGIAGLIRVHHIGSTSVPGLCAKPVLDLMPVFETEATADAAKDAVTALGYDWLGAFGLSGRRYCRLDDADTGTRRVQAHAYAASHPDIARHLAFRDWLRADPAHRDAYAAEKQRCAALHPDDAAAYGTCKSPWIGTAEAQALAAHPQPGW